MGDYSEILESTLVVKDHVGLLQLKNAYEKKGLEYLASKIIRNGNKLTVYLGEEKLEGYWDREMVDFLSRLAKFVEGEVLFVFDGGYAFKLIFLKGRVYRLKAENDWKANKMQILKAQYD